MTTQNAPEITPESLRAHADWVEHVYCADSTTEALRLFAGDLEREQDDEKRVDELVGVFTTAAFPGDARTHEPNDALRRGIRAVFAKLDEERLERNPQVVTAISDHFENPDDVFFRTRWATLADVPDSVTEVYRITGGSTVFERCGGAWFQKCGSRPDVRVQSGLIGPFQAAPF